MGVNVGDQFGILTVTARDNDYIQPSGRVRKMFICKCKCGVVKSYREDALKHLSSCGCLRNKDNALRQTKHSEARSRLYNIYYSMRNRCLMPKCSEYNRYGGRGITICKEWLEDNTKFFEWAKQNGYSENESDLSLERIDVNGNYCPENCKWIKIKEQYNNMRKTIRIGNLSLAEFCRQANLNYSIVQGKYYRTKDIVYALGFKSNPN